MKRLGPNYTAQEFRTCERMVLRALQFHLWKPTALEFAEKYVSILQPEVALAIRDKMHCALELCLRDCEMSDRKPSEVALSAIS